MRTHFLKCRLSFLSLDANNYLAPCTCLTALPPKDILSSQAGRRREAVTGVSTLPHWPPDWTPCICSGGSPFSFTGCFTTHFALDFSNRRTAVQEKVCPSELPCSRLRSCPQKLIPVSRHCLNCFHTLTAPPFPSPFRYFF